MEQAWGGGAVYSPDASDTFRCPAETILRGQQANMAAARNPLPICGLSVPVPVQRFSPRETKGLHDLVQSVRLIRKKAFCLEGLSR